MSYIIKWESIADPSTHGQGQPTKDKAIAMEWVQQQNAKYPELRHWIEEVKGE